MSTNLKLVAGTLSSACWPASPQLFANDLMARSAAVLGDITGVIISSSAPGANDRDKGWVKTSSGAPVWLGVFVYYNGQWVSPHPCPPSGQERRLWVGSTTDLENYDGGASGVVGPASGPMWEVDTDFNARFPLGPGTLPSGTVVNVGDTGGEEKHTLTVAEMPAHKHEPNAANAVGFMIDVSAGGIGTNSGGTEETSGPMTEVGGDQAHNTMPPYRAAYIIKRTARIFVLGA